MHGATFLFLLIFLFFGIYLNYTDNRCRYNLRFYLLFFSMLWELMENIMEKAKKDNNYIIIFLGWIYYWFAIGGVLPIGGHLLLIRWGISAWKVIYNISRILGVLASAAIFIYAYINLNDDMKIRFFLARVLLILFSWFGGKKNHFKWFNLW